MQTAFLRLALIFPCLFIFGIAVHGSSAVGPMRVEKVLEYNTTEKNTTFIQFTDLQGFLIDYENGALYAGDYYHLYKYSWPEVNLVASIDIQGLTPALNPCANVIVGNYIFFGDCLNLQGTVARFPLDNFDISAIKIQSYPWFNDLDAAIAGPTGDTAIFIGHFEVMVLDVESMNVLQNVSFADVAGSSSGAIATSVEMFDAETALIATSAGGLTFLNLRDITNSSVVATTRSLANYSFPSAAALENGRYINVMWSAIFTNDYGFYFLSRYDLSTGQFLGTPLNTSLPAFASSEMQIDEAQMLLYVRYGPIGGNQTIIRYQVDTSCSSNGEECYTFYDSLPLAYGYGAPGRNGMLIDSKANKGIFSLQMVEPIGSHWIVTHMAIADLG